MEGIQVPHTQSAEGEDHHMDDAPKENPDLVAANGSIDADNMGSSTADDSEVPSDLQMIHRRGLLPTGCCYDSRMKMHLNADFNPHAHHPEDPQRIHMIFEAFKREGLVYMGPEDQMARILRDCPTRHMWRIPARMATSEEILLCHTRRHLEWVEMLDEKSLSELREMTKERENTRTSLYVGAMSHKVARLSCGGAIDTCKAVVSGQVKNAFAVIRPPGHHAEHDTPMGFCFFNNVPVGVRVCQKDYPETCRKVLILDWDVHHGNGIQDIFYDDPNVLYISLHVYQNGSFYPGQAEEPWMPDGGIKHCGEGEGLGKNVNIGWDSQGMGDGEYLAAFQKVVMPIAQEFDPDLVVISAGFDAADGDQLGRCHVTPQCYAHMTHMLMSLANGKVVAALEGGYDLDAISNSAVAVAKTLMGEPPPKITIPPLNQQAERMLNKVQAYHAPYWRCMRGAIMDAEDIQSKRAESLLDYLRTAQRHVLQMKHKMVPVYVAKERVHRLYENQVLVTPELHSARKILVIIHDPPELRVEPDLAHDFNVLPQDSWVMDGVSNYIDWAVEKGFGVMDINVPGYKAPPDEILDEGFNRVKAAKEDLRQQMLTLMPFLWDNYLELSAASEIFLLGVGQAYIGIKELLLARDCRNRLSGIISFVTGDLYGVHSDRDDNLRPWYRSNARLYITEKHLCWTDESFKKKLSKMRYGDARRSSETYLNEMMATHARDAQQLILEKTQLESDDESTEGDEDDGN